MYHFASLQSETAKKLLGNHKISQDFSSIALIEDGKVYQKSEAVLRICKNLKKPCYIGSWLLIIPISIRDWVYDFVAANRYKWFGKRDYCELINTNQKIRFLDI